MMRGVKRDFLQSYLEEYILGEETVMFPKLQHLKLCLTKKQTNIREFYIYIIFHFFNKLIKKNFLHELKMS
jgi:hypothetical protein